MELLQLTYFCHAAHSESFSQVARAFRVPPSSVSLSVKRLESELGVPLFDRSANRLFLNENGKRFLSRAEAALGLLDSAKGELDREGELSGEVRILIRAARRVILERIAAFRTLHPKVTFSIHHKPLSDGTSYHLVVSDASPRTGHYEELPLLEEKMMLAVPKDHPLASRRSVSLMALDGEKMIAMTRGGDLREYTDRMFSAEGVLPEISIECDDPFSVREYVRIGLGVTVYPEISWKNQFDGDVSILSLEGDYRRKTSVFLSGSAPHAAREFARFAVCHGIDGLK